MTLSGGMGWGVKQTTVVACVLYIIQTLCCDTKIVKVPALHSSRLSGMGCESKPETTSD